MISRWIFNKIEQFDSADRPGLVTGAIRFTALLPFFSLDARKALQKRNEPFLSPTSFLVPRTAIIEL
jgi:hypothetical protein